MFPNTIEAVSDGTTADLVYDLKFTEGQKSFRRLVGAALDSEPTLTISHTESGKGVSLVRSSLMRVDRPVTDVDGNSNVIDAHLVLRNPTSVAEIADVVKSVKTLLNVLQKPGYLEKFIGGEI